RPVISAGHDVADDAGNRFIQAASGTCAGKALPGATKPAARRVACRHAGLSVFVLSTHIVDRSTAHSVEIRVHMLLPVIGADARLSKVICDGLASRASGAKLARRAA